MDGSSVAAPVKSNDPSLKTSGYEIANALGRLNADRPLLGEACVNEVPVAKGIRFFLHALDLHCRETGKTPAQVGRDISRGKIELRFNGGFATVVCR